MIEKWLWIKLKTTWNIREQIEKEKLKIRDQTKKKIKIKDQKILFTYFFYMTFDILIVKVKTLVKYDYTILDVL